MPRGVKILEYRDVLKEPGGLNLYDNAVCVANTVCMKLLNSILMVI